MKFCQICGRPLNDGEVCNCQAQQAAPQQPAQQSYYQQPQYQQPQYAQPAASAAPAVGDSIVDSLKNLPNAAIGYLKDGDGTLKSAKAKKDLFTPIFFWGIFFFANLILGIIFFARGTSYSMSNGSAYLEGLGDLQGTFLKGFKSFNYFNFGFVLLSAIIMTIVICLLYVAPRFVAQVIFAKKDAGDALFGSFIEFGYHLVPVSCLVVVGALLGLATCWLIVPFLGLAAAYLVVQAVVATVKEVGEDGNKLVFTIYLTVSVMLAVALAFWMLRLMCSMNFAG